jgi:hypothetical protein
MMSMSRTPGASHDRSQSERTGATALGVVLITLGGVFLFATSVGAAWAQTGWPIFIIVPGLGLFAVAVLGGKSWSGLAVPASIVTTVGVILWCQNAFDLWQTWAYAWALIPTAMGFGLWLHGRMSGRPDLQRQGRPMLITGTVLFVGFAAFFEGLLNLSGLGTTIGMRYALPALLIALGAWLVIVRRPLTHE